MLIRSQNKAVIINLDNIDSISADCWSGEVNVFNGEDAVIIGQYSSKEKAIKVLDMIQKEYGTHYYGTGGPMATSNFYIPPFGFDPPKVFQMPQDSEVEV
jgi:hypothetical protein